MLSLRWFSTLSIAIRKIADSDTSKIFIERKHGRPLWLPLASDRDWFDIG